VPAGADWSAERFPDPARAELRKRYRRAFEAGVRHVRAVLRSKLPADRPDEPTDWAPIAAFARADAGMRDWLELLDRLAQLAGDNPPEPLVPFLTRSSFEMSFAAVEVRVPVDLSSQPLAPGEVLTLTHGSPAGRTTAYKMKRTGDPTRHDDETVARYVPDGWGGKLTLAPGDSLVAAVPVSVEAGQLRLVWDSTRTRTFAFESLARPAALVPATGPRTPAAGVRVTITPSDGLPAVPAVLPDLSVPPK
jgi:hypothetical protein